MMVIQASHIMAPADRVQVNNMNRATRITRLGVPRRWSVTQVAKISILLSMYVNEANHVLV
jgi:hypothetical protein